jgi:prevent-host-death family protein
MRTVGLKTLKNKLSEYVRAAAGGETILVTDRSRVVAELVPPRPWKNPPGAGEAFARAVREGWIAAAPLAGCGAPPASPTMTFDRVMEELRQDRVDR